MDLVFPSGPLGATFLDISILAGNDTAPAEAVQPVEESPPDIFADISNPDPIVAEAMAACGVPFESEGNGQTAEFRTARERCEAEEQQAAEEAVKRNRDRLLGHERPPFVGPIGPVDEAFIDAAILAAQCTAGCFRVDRVEDGFIRIDRRIGGAILYRTHVTFAGTVSCTEIPRESTAPAPGHPTVLAGVVDYHDPWPGYEATINPFRMVGIDLGPLPVIVETTGPENDWRRHYVLDPATGGLNCITYDRLYTVQDRTHYPPGPAQLQTRYRAGVRPLKGKHIWRLATTIAAKINVKFERNSSSGPMLDQTFDHLYVQLNETHKQLRRRYALKSFGRQLSHEAEDTLYRAIERLSSRVLSARGRIMDLPPRPDPVTAPPANPKEIYGQLKALEAEFGGLIVDYQTRHFGVITPDITLRDPDSNQDIPLGAFRLTYPWNDFDAPMPAVAGFTAWAIDPHYPKPGDSSLRNYTHPHISTGKICFGTAVDPLGRLLQGGRIYEAFLVTYATLAEYGDGANPYYQPWRWLYTDAEKLAFDQARGRRLPAPPISTTNPADEDEDYEDEDYEDDPEDEDSDEDICPDCDHTSDNCSCRDCHSCDRTYNAEDEGQDCRDCGNDTCGNCIAECDCGSCGRNVCNGCAQSCDNCSHLHVCQDCSRSCNDDSCNRVCCDDCVRCCAECDERFCDDCMDHCSHCYRNLCHSCMERHGDMCHGCWTRICPRALEACPACGRATCRDCLTSPSHGLTEVCPDCMVRCMTCDRELGAHEIVLDGLCPACFSRRLRDDDDQRRAAAEVRADLRAGPGQPLLLGLFAELGERNRPAALAHRARPGDRPGPVLHQAELQPGGGRRPGDGDDDHAPDRAGALPDGGGGPDGVLGGGGGGPDAAAPAPAAADREYRPFTSPTGDVLWAWIYPGLPLFNLCASTAEEGDPA